MVSLRTATAALGLLLSLVVSATAWIYFDTLLLFLAVPFVPLLFRRQLDGARVRAAVSDLRLRDPGAVVRPLPA